MNRRDIAGALGALALALAGPALAQAPADPAAGYPSGVVRLVVPFSAGSMTDILARAVAEKLGQRWGGQVIVENRPGIAGTAGVAKAAPDGMTLMVTSNGHVIVGAINKDINFDPLKDFAPISQVATLPSILIAPPEGPVRTVKDLIEAAKARPGALNYASAGLGSSTGIAAELFRQTIDVPMAHVPHRGLPESQTSVIRGDAAMAFTFFNVGGDIIQGGRLRALAVTGPRRMPQLPDVPTFAEAGLPAFQYDAWFGVMAPAGTPPAIVAKVSRDVAEALRAPDMKARFDPQGVELVSSTPEAFGAVMRADAERFGRLYPR